VSVVVALSRPPILQFSTAAGVPLAGGTLTIYQAGTTILATVYSEYTGTTVLPNPNTLNSRGEIATNAGASVPLYIPPNTAFKFVLKDALSNIVWTEDNVTEVQTILTQTIIGTTLWPQTAEERAASVAPVVYYYPPGDVRRYGAVLDGSTDDTAAFQNASAASLNPYSPSGVTKITNTIFIRSNQQWRIDGLTVNVTGTSIIVFRASDGITDWAFLGRVTVVGDNDAIGSIAGSAAALYIGGCKRYYVENFNGKNIKGWAVKIDPGTVPLPRGDQGVLVGCGGFSCYTGFENTSGTGAEYCTMLGWRSTKCNFGIIVAAGNTTFSGGNCEECTNGVAILSGSNHAHGIFSAMNINHNINYNVKFDTVTFGQSFVGCHFYSDDNSHGYIWFSNSKGCHISDGSIDSPILNDGTAGLNKIIDCIIPGTFATVAGANPKYLVLLRNMTMTAAWSNNDAGICYVNANRGGSTFAITSGTPTTVVFNSEDKDNRDAFDNTTGIFTAPYAANYRFTCTLQVTGTGLTNPAYFDFYFNNSTIVGFGAMAGASGGVGGSGVVDVIMAQGDTMRVRATVTGTTPVVAITNSRFQALLLS
jgi:hypothetical protein